MSLENIQQLYDEDWNRFKKSRQYFRHKVDIELAEIHRTTGLCVWWFFRSSHHQESELLETALENLTDYEREIVKLTVKQIKKNF